MQMSSKHRNKGSHLARQQTTTQTQIITAAKFEGPLPHPDLLEKYETIVPGGAERIFARFEKQSDHRMQLEANVINGDNKRANWGLFIGGFLAFILISGGIFLSYINKPLEGLSSIGIASAGLFINAFWNRKRRQDDIDKKR